MSKGLTFAERDFFRQRLDADEIRALVVNGSVAALFSARSPSVAKLGLEPASMTEEQMLAWMVREPRLLRRPFMLVDGELIVQPKLGELDNLLA